MRDYRLSLADIFAAMVQARAFIEGMDIETFVADEKTVSAVIRQLEIIGEAAKNIPETIRRKYPHVPWRKMARTRDKLIHGYFAVDNRLVWKTVTDRDLVPSVQPMIAQILKDIAEEDALEPVEKET